MILSEINNLIEQLSSKEKKENQEYAMNQIISTFNELINKLILPPDKSCWENAAIILRQIGCPVNDYTAPKLLAWLKDMNWPGAMVVKEIFLGYDPKIVILFIKDAIKRAVLDNDYIWLSWLKELLDSIIESSDYKLNSLIDEETRKMLSLALW